MKHLEVYNPATGDLLATLNIDTKDEVEQKLLNGFHAFSSWRHTSSYERADLLKRWADLILQNKESIAKIMTEENGKPYKESLAEISYSVSYLIWYSEEAKRIYGRTISANSTDKRIIITRQGVGLVAAITPWNFPAAMMTRKAGPALAAGCTFVVKPAEDTPLTMIRLVELAHEAGIPKNVVQCVIGLGSEIGPIFTQSQYVRKITFTGSTPVGKQLFSESASTIKHLSMELGGHAPFIVCEDADIDFVVEQAIASKFRNAGQTCVCANRFIVHKNIFNEFSEKFATAAKKLKIGNGLDEATDIGPLINQKGFKKVIEQIEDAKNKGATVLAGGKFIANESKNTFFVEPTILINITLDMNIMSEETFGPIAPIISFSSIDEAIEIANGTPFGLAAYYFTNNYKTGIYLQEALDFGIIGWNDGLPSTAQVPFGGLKESGLGREGGIEGLEHYLDIKYLSIGNL